MNKFVLVISLLLVLTKSASAGVMIESSRVVFSAGDRERSLMLANTNDYPVVVQAWVDHGKLDGTPENATEIPVMPLPGIFRLQPGEKKALRLLSTQIPQQQDRESLYWLNLYEIPPAEAHLPPGVQAVKVAVRVQLKLFFRPADLKISVDELGNKLQFSVVNVANKVAIKVTNPTPYYATFSSATVSDGVVSRPIVVGMLAPFSDKTVSVEGAAALQPKTISYYLINDQGNVVNVSKKF